MPADSDGQQPGGAGRAGRVAASGIGVVAVALLFAVAVSATPITYELPAPCAQPPCGTTEQTATFVPAVVASILTAICLAWSLVVLVVVLRRRRPPGWWWPVLVAAVVVAVAGTLYAVLAPQPSF